MTGTNVHSMNILRCYYLSSFCKELDENVIFVAGDLWDLTLKSNIWPKISIWKNLSLRLVLTMGSFSTTVLYWLLCLRVMVDGTGTWYHCWGTDFPFSFEMLFKWISAGTWVTYCRRWGWTQKLWHFLCYCWYILFRGFRLLILHCFDLRLVKMFEVYTHGCNDLW